MKEGETLRGNSEKPETRPIIDIVTLRKKMEGIWYRDISLDKVREDLERHKGEHLRDLLAVGYEMSAYLLQYGKTAEHDKPQPHSFDGLVLASMNPAKREFLSAVAEAQGLKVKDFHPAGSFGEEEEKAHKILRQLIKERKDYEKNNIPMEPTIAYYTPALYALDIAKEKAGKANAEHRAMPIIASDVVVLEGENILEKPKNKEGAVRILKELSGKEVCISLGAVLLVPSSMGKITIQEAARMRIALKHFSDADINKYLADAGNDFLNVAGAIDYSSPAARIFIDENTPVVIEKISDIKSGTSMESRSASFSPALLAEMKDYVIGVPNELMKELIEEGKILSK